MDVDITYSGVRPGEKLYEEVFFGHEAVEPTAHPKGLRSGYPPSRNSRASGGRFAPRLWRSSIRENGYPERRVRWVGSAMEW